MKLTIIPSDGFIAEDGVGYASLSWEGTPSNVHALQWDSSTPINRVLKSIVEEESGGVLVPVTKESIVTSYGWIEFNDGTPNEDISVLPSWVSNAETAWDAANNPPPPPPPPPPTADENATKAKQLLIDTDWVELPSVSDPVNDPYLSNIADFEEYRLWLRRVAVSPIAGDLPWPIKPIEDWR